jgi:hypothetical protein
MDTRSCYVEADVRQLRDILGSRLATVGQASSLAFATPLTHR